VAARKARSQPVPVSDTSRDQAGLGPASLPGDGGVLVVGDSLEVLTSPYLKQYMPAGTELTVNAEGGYNSLQIYDLFKESYDPSQSVIVFDAGTNDNPAYPSILQGRLDAVASEVGDRCMVVPTIHGFVVDGVDNSGKNRVVQSFAASRPGTQTPDWAGWVASHQDLMTDELHPNPEGSDQRAQLIAEGVRACLAGAP
jgi:lysophospholipase L1-like esterase